jgi:hypothetical protein
VDRGLYTKWSCWNQDEPSDRRKFYNKKIVEIGRSFIPIICNIVADMLTIIIKRAKIGGQIRGVIPHLVDNGLSILQHTDNTHLFMDDNLEKVKNIKLMLCAFEQLSGLKINFIRARSSALVMPGNPRIFILSFMGAKSEHTHLST